MEKASIFSKLKKDPANSIPSYIPPPLQKQYSPLKPHRQPGKNH